MSKYVEEYEELDEQYDAGRRAGWKARFKSGLLIKARFTFGLLIAALFILAIALLFRG